MVTEEYILLAFKNLPQSAKYIRECLGRVFEYEIPYGQLYTQLNRLVEKGYLKTYLTGPEKKRGGKSKQIFFLTAAGTLYLKQKEEMREKLK